MKIYESMISRKEKNEEYIRDGEGMSSYYFLMKEPLGSWIRNINEMGGSIYKGL